MSLPARLLVVLATTLTGPAGAQEAPDRDEPHEEVTDEATSCVQTKVWDAAAEGWSLRSLRGDALGLGARSTTLVTLGAGRTYRVLGCAGAEVEALDLVLYDRSGVVVQRAASSDRQPVLDLGVSTGTFYLVAHLRSARSEPTGATHPIAVAILHR